MPSTYTLKIPEGGATGEFVGVSFTNGTLDPSQYDKTKAVIYKPLAPQQTSNRRKMVIQTTEMDYVGDFDLMKKELGCAYFIGVGDPETGEMSVMPFRRVRLRPAVSSAPEEEPDEQQDVPVMSKLEMRDALTEAFGGAKQKRNMDSRLKHGIDKQMIQDALSTVALQQVSVGAPPTPIKAEKGESVLPPFDTTAELPENAYPLEGYFPLAVQISLSDYVSDFSQLDSQTLQSWVQQAKYPKTILQELGRLPMHEKDRHQTSILIKYLHYLMRLYRLKAHELKKADPLAVGDADVPTPPACLQYILQEYTVKDGKYSKLPDRMRDKVLVVIVLLLLRLGGYKMETASLMSDLGLTAVKLAQVSRAMGCKVRLDKSAAEPAVVVELKAPLVFQLPSAGKKRRT